MTEPVNWLISNKPLPRPLSRREGGYGKGKDNSKKIFKVFKIMKKNLRYYLLMAALMVVVSMSAQMFAQEPVATMHSTSSMVGSGSSLPSAAVGGASTSYGENGAPSAPGGPNRLPPKPTDPLPDPVGATPWVLMVMMAAGYAFGKKVARTESQIH